MSIQHSTPPVLFLLFNRPDLAERVFAEIRKAAPPRLYIAVDGPREGRPEEARAVEQCRALKDAVDWTCEVKTLFQETNLGCGRGVRTGIDWFFENEESGIILEDDCKPHPDFFEFCSVMLEKYRDDTRVFSVAGFCELPVTAFQGASYEFSVYNLIWGWASWRRAWRSQNFSNQELLDALESDWLEYQLHSPYAVQYWRREMRGALAGQIDTWDYQWRLSIWMNSGLSIIPSVNLVQNIGFDERATHTSNEDARYLEMEVGGLTKQLMPPLSVRASIEIDRRLDKDRFRISAPQPPRPIWERGLRKLHSWVRGIVKG